ncbi:MAG: GGDEF domain-containing protein [Pirellulales bacterium]|nr:GGDEF domain-containing protein [Pirellulales bacterium]
MNVAILVMLALIGVAEFALGVLAGRLWAASRGPLEPTPAPLPPATLPAVRPERAPVAAVAAAPAASSPELTVQVAQHIQDIGSLMQSDITRHAESVQEFSNRLEQSSRGSAADSHDPALIEAVKEMVAANSALQQRLRDAEEKLSKQAEQLKVNETAARTDGLTAIANRRAFEEHLAKCRLRWTERSIPTTLMMIDVDHFKKFNDTHGHLAGDAVLKQVAKTLAGSVRDGDFAARYGGEEFAVLFGATEMIDIGMAADRIRQAIEAMEIEFAEKRLKVTISCGLAETAGDESTQNLISRADKALYAAKQNGRNRVYCEHRDTTYALVMQTPKEAHSGEEDPSELDRRRIQRRLRIGPLTDGNLPASNEFFPVMCRDITPTGLCFYLEQEPLFTSLVIEMNEGEELVPVLADLVDVRAADTYGGGYQCKCRFHQPTACADEAALATV